MSAQEFDQMDEELMGMVNDHAAPAAVADAEEIVERVTAPKTESAAEKLDPNDYLQDTGDSYRISEDQLNKLQREVEAKARNKTLLAVILSLVNTAYVPVWFCMEGSRRLLLSLENHINLYARTRVCGLGKGLTIQPFYMIDKIAVLDRRGRRSLHSQ